MEFFLSYHHDDKILAGKVKQEIQRRGSEAFLAHEDIEVSKTWRSEILSHLRSCNALIAIVTDSFPKSFYANQEVGMIMGKGKPVVSLIFGGTLPGFLESIQAIHASEPNIRIDVERAIKDITGRELATYIEPAFKTTQEIEETAISEVRRHILRTISTDEQRNLKFTNADIKIDVVRLDEEKGFFELAGIVFYELNYSNNHRNWSMVIDARTGRILNKSVVYGA